MKKFILLLPLIYLLSANAFAGNTYNENDRVRKFISKNVAFPKNILQKNQYQKVSVSFIINKNGLIQVTGMSEVSPEMEQHIKKELNGLKYKGAENQDGLTYKVDLVFKML